MVGSRTNSAFGFEGSEPAAVSEAVEKAINDQDAAEPPAAPDKSRSQIQVEFDGEIFAGHSFSNVNEQLLLEFEKDPSIALKLHRVFHNPTDDRLAPRADVLLGLASRH